MASERSVVGFEVAAMVGLEVAATSGLEVVATSGLEVAAASGSSLDAEGISARSLFCLRLQPKFDQLADSLGASLDAVGFSPGIDRPH